jgi:hypothetical protein
VYDASAKLSSGVLSGNVNRYGDFDECLNAIADNEMSFSSQYCLAYIQPNVASHDDKYLNYLRTLALSFEAYKSKFDDVNLLMNMLILNSSHFKTSFANFVFFFEIL